MRLTTVAASVLACLGILAVAPAGAANLGAIVELARAADAQYGAARAAALTGPEKYLQGRAGLLPSVSLLANARHNRDESTNYIGPRPYDSSVWSVSVTQPLLRAVNVETFHQGELQATLAEQQLRLAEQDLLLRVAKAYFDVLQAQDVLASVGAQKVAFAQQLAQARRTFEVGTVPITDVNEAQSRYDLTLAQEIAARNDIEVKRRALEKSIGRETPRLAMLDPQAAIDILPPSLLDALAEGAQEDAWPVLIGQTNERIAQRDVSKQSAGHMPTLDVVLSAGENRNTQYGAQGGANTFQATMSLELAVPIYQGGAVSSREREALANLERTRQELLNARRQAQFDARQSLLGVQSGLALFRALQRAQVSNETQVRSTQRGLDVGVRTRVDVLNAEQQLYATRKDLAVARYQTLVSGLQLKAAAGRLIEQDLRDLDALLKD
jgi:outer membrane protein